MHVIMPAWEQARCSYNRRSAPSTFLGLSNDNGRLNRKTVAQDGRVGVAECRLVLRYPEKTGRQNRCEGFSFNSFRSISSSAANA